jgi:hypothetical protein
MSPRTRCTVHLWSQVSRLLSSTSTSPEATASPVPPPNQQNRTAHLGVIVLTLLCSLALSLVSAAMSAGAASNERIDACQHGCGCRTVVLIYTSRLSNPKMSKSAVIHKVSQCLAD